MYFIIWQKYLPLYNNTLYYEIIAAFIYISYRNLILKLINKLLNILYH